MMKKNYLIISFVVLTCIVNAQEKENWLNKRIKEDREASRIWNEQIKQNEQKIEIKRMQKFEANTPGDYLIKSKNQILSGIGMQIFACGVAYITDLNYAQNIKNLKHGEKIPDSPKNVYIGCAVLGIIGFGFEVSGIFQIGNAGLSLNQNGIGVKVKFHNR